MMGCFHPGLYSSTNWPPFTGGQNPILTLKDPFISESCIEIKIELNFHFHETNRKKDMLNNLYRPQTQKTFWQKFLSASDGKPIL